MNYSARVTVGTAFIHAGRDRRSHISTETLRTPGRRQDPELTRWYQRLSALHKALIITAIWRVCVALSGALSHYVLHSAANYHSLLGHGWPVNPLTLAVDASVRLDAYWYARVALHGYHFNPHYISSIGYFPLYPILIKAVSLLTGNVYVAGVLISTACTFIAVYLFYLWLENRGLEGRIVWVTALMLSFPFAFFFAAMFTESLYLCLALATFVFAERQRWALASAVAFLAVLSRPTALALLPALLVLAWVTRSRAALAPVVASAAALAAFGVYQLAAFGTPLAYVRTHNAPPTSVTPQQVLSDLTLHARPGMPSWYLAFMLFWGVFFLALVPTVYKRFGPVYAVYTAFSVLLPLASSLPGLERYVLVAFPVFASLSLSPKRRQTILLIVIWFGTEILATAMFARGYALF